MRILAIEGNPPPMTMTETALPAGQQADLALLRLGQELKSTGYRFTTVTPATHARVNRRPANAVARSLRDVFGWSRPFRSGAVPAGLFELLRTAGAVERPGALRSGRPPRPSVRVAAARGRRRAPWRPVAAPGPLLLLR